MKKIFSILAVALVAFSLASCNNKKDEPSVPTVKLNFTENVRFDDYVASEGWWQVMAEDTTYFLTLSNKDAVTQIAGTYTASQLDPEYSYVGIYATEQTVTFIDGSVTLSVSGKQVSITGKLTGADSIVYEINVLYTAPEAKQTVNVNIAEASLYEGYADYGLYAFYGTASNAYVQLAIWAEDGLQGHFTEEDLDVMYLGSGVSDDEGDQTIYTASIDVTPGNGEGYYNVVADLLCYNNTLYKVNMTVLPSADEAAAAPKKAPAKKGFKAIKAAKAL